VGIFLVLKGIIKAMVDESHQVKLYISLAKFYQITGNWPRHLTVIGFEFKKKRFVEHHRKALRFPLERFHYIGINAPHQGQEVIDREVVSF
jgi:hypothetical protein